MTSAMFVRMRGLWHFSGITSDPDEIALFVRNVEKDIKLMRNDPAVIRTDNYRIIELPDCALWEQSVTAHRAAQS